MTDVFDTFAAWIEQVLASLRHDTQRDYRLAG